MRGQYDRGFQLFRRRRPDVESSIPNGDFANPVAQARQLSVQELAHACLVSGDGFDIDELASQGNQIHAGQHNSPPVINERPAHELQVSPSYAYITVLAETSTIRSLFIDGPTGRLEALLNEGSESASHAALVCHPHPLYGGTLHNKVVFHTMKALNSFGFPVLRFNFRGTGLSHGVHDNGVGEVDDVRAALDWQDREFHLPMIFAGFSFGAAVGLQAACGDERVRAVIGLGVPVLPADERSYDLGFLRVCQKPKLFVSGSRDQFGPRNQLGALIQTLPDPKKLVLIEGGDHFFEGRLRELREVIERWISETLKQQPRLRDDRD